MGPSDAVDRLGALCATVGFDLGTVDPSLVARWRLLAERTETASDCEQMVSRALRVFRHYELTRPDEAFTPADRRVVVLGCLFSDIGKAGPLGADTSAQQLIVEMFSVEGVRDDAQPVSKFLTTYFPTDAERRIEQFAALGLSPQMTIREFWNLHSEWTLDVAEAGSVPPEVIAAAATHHLLDGINPDAIVASDRRFTRSFGDNRAFDRPEKLVILLDKYDALLRRGGLTHQQAIAWLRERVLGNQRFHDDAEFMALIAELDAALVP